MKSSKTTLGIAPKEFQYKCNVMKTKKALKSIQQIEQETWFLYKQHNFILNRRSQAFKTKYISGGGRAQ